MFTIQPEQNPANHSVITQQCGHYYCIITQPEHSLTGGGKCEDQGFKPHARFKEVTQNFEHGG